nr:MAG TPA: hypothetical protein [Caudoviricetes sp.]
MRYLQCATIKTSQITVLSKTLKGLFCISFETPYWQASPRPKRTSWQYYVCADKYIITSRTELTSCTICVVA